MIDIDEQIEHLMQIYIISLLSGRDAILDPDNLRKLGKDFAAEPDAFEGYLKALRDPQLKRFDIAFNQVNDWQATRVIRELVANKEFKGGVAIYTAPH